MTFQAPLKVGMAINDKSHLEQGERGTIDLRRVQLNDFGNNAANDRSSVARRTSFSSKLMWRGLSAASAAFDGGAMSEAATRERSGSAAGLS